MAPHPRRSPARTLRHHLVQAAGVTIIGALVAMALLPGSVDIADTTGGDAPVASSQARTPADAHLAALMDRYRCSTEGFGHSEIPESAIIRRSGGQVRLVSFDRGWQVFQDHGPTSLVAVCLRPPA